jgi:hypothetical protein
MLGYFSARYTFTPYRPSDDQVRSLLCRDDTTSDIHSTRINIFFSPRFHVGYYERDEVQNFLCNEAYSPARYLIRPQQKRPPLTLRPKRFDKEAALPAF